MSDQSRRCPRRTSKDTTSATGSPASAAGRKRSGSPATTAQESGPPAYPVSRFRARESDKAMSTDATCGPLFIGSSPSAVLQSCLENKLREHWDVSGSLEYELTWMPEDMPAGPAICRLRARAPRTSDSESGGLGSWLTPAAGDSEAAVNPSEGARVMLPGQAQLAGWPTAMARSGGGLQASAQKALERLRQGHHMNLDDVAALVTGWRTPTATEGSRGALKIENLHGRSTITLTTQAHYVLGGWATPAERGPSVGGGEGRVEGRAGGARQGEAAEPAGAGVADPGGRRRAQRRANRAGGTRRERSTTGGGWRIRCVLGRLGYANGDGQLQGGEAAAAPGHGGAADSAGSPRNPWGEFDLVLCRDGRLRRVESRIQWMDYGVSGIMAPDGTSETKPLQEGVVNEATATRPDPLLPILRSEIAEEAVPNRDAGGQDGVRQAPILRSEVHGGRDGREDQGAERQGRAPTVSEAGEGSVRTMLGDREAACTSHGREPAEQRRVEPDDVVSLLSQVMARDSWECELEARGAMPHLRGAFQEAGVVLEALSEAAEVWGCAPDETRQRIGRLLGERGSRWVTVSPVVATVTNGWRNGMLRGYGNSIVPEVAARFIVIADMAMEEAKGRL